MAKLKKLMAVMLTAVLAVSAVPATQVMADGTGEKVVTLGADLSKEQKEMMLKYFGIEGEDIKTLTVTNADERDYLQDYVPLEEIGTRTISCALVKPTSSGGIQVKTANLTWVTSNMIASTLSTCGVVNCQVLAASPIAVSGTGALTGIIMSYEASTGRKLDEKKVRAANRELVVTGRLGDRIGPPRATLLVNRAKTLVIEGNVTNVDEITNIVNNVTYEYNLNITQEDTELLVELLEEISKLDYDLDDMKETLDRVEENVTREIEQEEEEENILKATNDEELGDEAVFDATDPEMLQIKPEIEAEEETENILDNTDDSALGDSAIIDTTEKTEAAAEAETESAPETETPEETEPETEEPVQIMAYHVVTIDYEFDDAYAVSETENYDVGETVEIMAEDLTASGYEFNSWLVESLNVEPDSLTDPAITFVMPDEDVSITAIYDILTESDGTERTEIEGDPVSLDVYTITVETGYIIDADDNRVVSAQCGEEDTVEITVQAQIDETHIFTGWNISPYPEDLVFTSGSENEEEATLTFTMPGDDVTITALMEEKQAEKETEAKENFGFEILFEDSYNSEEKNGKEETETESEVNAVPSDPFDMFSGSESGQKDNGSENIVAPDTSDDIFDAIFEDTGSSAGEDTAATSDAAFEDTSSPAGDTVALADSSNDVFDTLFEDSATLDSEKSSDDQTLAGLPTDEDLSEDSEDEETEAKFTASDLKLTPNDEDDDDEDNELIDPDLDVLTIKCSAGTLSIGSGTLTIYTDDDTKIEEIFMDDEEKVEVTSDEIRVYFDTELSGSTSYYVILSDDALRLDGVSLTEFEDTDWTFGTFEAEE